MITTTRFREIDNEIKSLIRKTLDDIRVNNFDNYILYIADGDYNIILLAILNFLHMSSIIE